jgi:3-hydroxyacyl-CoA dehydrogenase, NAD binding domain
MNDITRVGVMGCGLMGSGLAGVCTHADLDIVVREINNLAAATGRRRIGLSLDRAVTAGHDRAAGRPTRLRRCYPIAHHDYLARGGAAARRGGLEPLGTQSADGMPWRASARMRWSPTSQRQAA